MNQLPVNMPPLDKPSVARVYDYLLGGKDNYDIDRRLATTLLNIDPEIPHSAAVNRSFGLRVVDYLAREQGITQFIDLGCGIPTTEPTVHHVARSHHPQARVLYIDNDPVVKAHAAALRCTGPGLDSLYADITAANKILESPEFAETIDPTQPVGLLCFSVMQTVDNTMAAAGALSRLAAPFPTGSWLGLSHVSAERSQPAAVSFVRSALDSYGYPPVAWRSDTAIASLFDGFTIQEPGLLEVQDWRPSDDDPDHHLKVKLIGGVGKKLPKTP